MSDENTDIALLALQSQMGLNHIYQTRMPNKIDPRQFINNPQGGYVGGNRMPQQQGMGNEEYGVPSYIPAQPVQQIPLVMRQPDGSILDLSQAPSGAVDINSNRLNGIQGFQIPDYSKYNPKEDVKEESALDLILKEIKVLKRSINKLIRDFEKAKLGTEQKNNPAENINDTNRKFTDLSEGISSSNIGD